MEIQIILLYIIHQSLVFVLTKSFDIPNVCFPLYLPKQSEIFLSCHGRWKSPSSQYKMLGRTLPMQHALLSW